MHLLYSPKNQLLIQSYFTACAMLYLNSFMLLAGVTTFESLTVSIVVGIQILVGIILFSKTSTFEENDFSLVLGAGITIGTSTTLVFHQVFRSSPISSIAWLIPAIVAVLILILRFRDNTTRPGKEISIPPIRYVFIGFILTAIGLADQWWWLYPIIFSFSAISFSCKVLFFVLSSWPSERRSCHRAGSDASSSGRPALRSRSPLRPEAP